MFAKLTAEKLSDICEGLSFIESEADTVPVGPWRAFSEPLPDRQELSLEWSQSILSAPSPEVKIPEPEEERVKMRKVMDPQAIAALVKQAAMEATEANKIAFGTIVQGHLNSMKTEILAEVDTKISPLTERIAKLENEWKSNGGGGGGGGGGGSGSVSTNVPSEYKPKYLEIKGFVTNWSTNEGSLDEAQAKA